MATLSLPTNTPTPDGAVIGCTPTESGQAADYVEIDMTGQPDVLIRRIKEV